MQIVTKEIAIKNITKLINNFDEHYDNFHISTYDEAKTRGTFINEFFEALGWDVNNRDGVDESYRDVIPEFKMKVEGRTKAPDYCFTISGHRKFLVEAKKPSIPIKIDQTSVFQLRSYGWHNKLPISIITNFEEFAIYDCTRKPFPNDKTSIGRIKHLNYKDYIKDIDFLWNTFSKESVLKGRFDKYIKSDTEKRGTSAVDNDFLVSLNEWRKYLASNIARNNHRLTAKEVQYAVQQTIDRIIFLIFCEYKNIENYSNLKNAADKGNFYKNLFELFIHADKKYNSGLFDFNKDKNSQKIIIDNNIIESIITDLYPPNSEYDFSILPVEVLGNAYEMFLGKVIRITPGRIVKIEDKPEVKKANGVFYTPEYIVDYIVKNTVGKLILGKSPSQISKIKIVDPACGSGSFLLGAFQFLLNYHRDYYIKKGFLGKKSKNNPLTPEGRLTTEEKRNILLNNIYGVDIDPQAVEVTKLSLLLKAMEGETEVSIKRQLQFFHERVLPNIDDNIKCGNSLISYDFFDGELELNKEETKKLEDKINPFDWKSAFPEIFKQGGFDAVIGNPPWVFTRDVEFGESVKQYYKFHYLNNVIKSERSRENQTGKANLYALFIIKGTDLLNENGLMGFIIPNTILRTTVYESVRKYLIDSTCIEKIVDLKAGVFEKVTASTILLFLSLNKKKKEILVIDNPEKEQSITATPTIVFKETFLNNPSYSFNIFVEKNDSSIFSKILKQSTNLSTVVDVFNGIATYKNKQGISESKKNNIYKKLLFGKDIGRYSHNWGGKYIEYVPKKLQRARDENIFLADEKLIMQRIGGILVTSYDDKQFYTFNSVNNLLLKKVTKVSLKFVLALLNSQLFKFYYVKNFTNNSSLTVNISKTYLDKLPLKKIDYSDKKEKSIHDEIIKQVDKLLQLNKDIHKTRIPLQQERIKNKISYSENRIDELVFELYRLSKKDIEIINNNLQ